MMKTYVGIDNGITGSIGIITPEGAEYYQTPVFKEQSYTKKKQQITRIDTWHLNKILSPFADGRQLIAMIERPYVNPQGFKATSSALRALEATLVTLERIGVPYQYIDSREWQKAMLPTGLKGAELKHASKDIGIRLFPQLKAQIIKQKDADGILIAEYAKRANL